MKATLIVMSSKTGTPEKQTKETLARLVKLGAGTLMEIGSTDVAFARCRALSAVCDQLRERPERDMVLMIDDDMEVADEVAQAVVDAARRLQRGCSAAYATASAKLAGTPFKGHPGRWLVGLGCLAIPRALVLRLEETSLSFEHMGRHYSAFTWCGPDAGEWVGEDFQLSKRLGGVHLLPLAVGHIKKGVLWPDDGTLAQIAALGGET